MKKYLALKASAGSGKTFALTVRYITLLLLGAKPNEILTLTFTNKAANEMSERIYKTLLTLGDDEAYLSAIEKQSGLSKQEILGKKGFLVKSFSSATLSIFTIDKFIIKPTRFIFRLTCKRHTQKCIIEKHFYHQNGTSKILALTIHFTTDILPYTHPINPLNFNLLFKFLFINALFNGIPFIKFR